MHLRVFPIEFHDDLILPMQNLTGKNAGSIQSTQVSSANDPHPMQVRAQSMHQSMQPDPRAMQLMQV